MMAAFLIPAIAGAASSAMASHMQIGAAEDQADSYKFKAERAKMAGEFAMTQTKLNNANLMAQYNETQANAVLMGAIQGRSGATLANIAAQDAENLAWDMEFMELSGIVQKAGYDIDAAGYRQAGAEGIQSAYKKSAVGLLGSATKFAKVL